MNQAAHARHTAPEVTAAVLRERIYGGIACLSTILVLLRYTDADDSSWTAVVDVAIATGGLWAASLFADYVAHLVATGHGPSASSAAGVARASSQILQASAVPLLLLTIAGFGGTPYTTALTSRG